LNILVRKKENERIEKENQAFAKRLFDKSGCISKKKFDEEYFANTQYRNNLIKVPHNNKNRKNMPSYDGRLN
jgi:dephospho-CoA kinase